MIFEKVEEEKENHKFFMMGLKNFNDFILFGYFLLCFIMKDEICFVYLFIL